MKDPELPNGLQDADIEMSELQATASQSAKLRKMGICAHGWLQCPPGPAHNPTSVVTCLDCGKVFQSEEEAHDERQEVLS